MCFPVRQLAASIFAFSLFFVGVSSAQTNERVSVDSQGNEGTHSSYIGSPASMSADGRYVVFSSKSYTFVPGDTNSDTDVFVHDRQTGITERVNVNSQGQQSNNNSSTSPQEVEPGISSDGRYVVFSSKSANLVSGDTNGSMDVFIHDRQTGTTERVSVDSQGVQGNSYSTHPSVSTDGRFVTFTSGATNFATNDSNDESDVFLHDRLTGSTTCLSVSPQGSIGNEDSYTSAISADGLSITFTSSATNLVPGGATRGQIYVHDRLSETNEVVSLNSSGSSGNAGSRFPSISYDGRYVAFESWASNLVPGDLNGFFQDVFIRDRKLGITHRASVDSFGGESNAKSLEPSISGDGRHVIFISMADNLIPNDLNGKADVFLHELITGVTERIAVESTATSGAIGYVLTTSISENGRYVAFESRSPNLVPGDTNGVHDIFVQDRWSTHGSDTIVLAGPSTAPVGVPLDLNWSAAPPNTTYRLIRSMNTNGSAIGWLGHHGMDLGAPRWLLASGTNSNSGTGSFTSAPIPNSAMGYTVYFEVLARTSIGVFDDSNALAVNFF